MKKPIVTLICFVLFAGLLAYTLMFQRGRVKEKEEVFRGDIAKEADLTKIEIVKYDNAAQVPDPKRPGRMTFQRKETQRLAIEKQGDDWVATQPFQGYVDPDQAKTIVKAIVELKPNVRTDKDLKLKDFGLEQPQLEVSIGLSSGESFKIAIGDNSPVGGKTFASISGKEGLFLLPTSFRTDLDKDPTTLRDKKLARFEVKDVKQVTLVNPKGTFVLTQNRKNDKEAEWAITSPEQVKADEWAVTSALNKVTQTDAGDFAPATDLKALGLEPPRASMKVELKDGKTLDIAVGSQVRRKISSPETGGVEQEKDLVYVSRQGRQEVLLLDSTLFDDLNKDVLALRDRKILTVKRDDVLGMKVERTKGFGFSVQRTGDDWTMQSPTTDKALKTKIDDIIWDLADLEAKEYLDPKTDLKAIGLAVPSTVITLRLKGGKSSAISIGDEVKSGAETLYYLQTSDGPQAYKVGELVVRDLPEKAEDLKEPAGGAMPPGGNRITMPPLSTK